MASKFYIPNKLTVGFSTEEKASTGKLAQITYKDAKGNLVRERPWKQSIDDIEKGLKRIFIGYEKHEDGKVNYAKPLYKDIVGFPVVEIDNTPTRGFILNKIDNKVTWETKPSSCYFLDPRGFEIPINLNNLLYILSLTNGNYINTDFVYSWADDVLVLLPCNSQEYIDSVEFQDVKTMKFNLKDLKVGCVYYTKNLSKAIYMGRFDQVETNQYINSYMGARRLVTSKSHIFALKEGNKTIFTSLSSSSIAKPVSNDVSPEFQQILNQLESSGKILSAENIEITPISIADMLQKERDIDDNRLSGYTNNNNKDQFIGYVSQPKGNNTYEVFKLFQNRAYVGRGQGINQQFTIVGYKLKPSFQEYNINGNNISVKTTKTITQISNISQDRTGAYNIPVITEQQANELNLVKIKLKFKNSDKILTI